MELTEKELVILASYYDKIGQDIEDLKKTKKIADGLYRSEKITDLMENDTERIEIKFTDDNCHIKRVNTHSFGYEGKVNWEIKTYINEIEDDFQFSDNQVKWKTTKKQYDTYYDGYSKSAQWTTDDITSDKFLSPYYMHYLGEKVSQKEAPTTVSNAFTDISELQFSDVKTDNHNKK